ncbi:transposable element Tc1 transposase [Trichonephila clavipes]|nr:transposable element Tc1 transposase [Trichonephila clavipes]
MGKLPDLDAFNRVRVERLLRRTVRSQTLAQITSQFNDRASRAVSKRAVQRSLQRVVFGRRRPTRVPLLNAHHRAARLAWTRKRRDWSVENKKRIAWSDGYCVRLMKPRILHISPDLNPIESLLDVLEQGMKGLHTASTNLTELLTALANIWQVIPVQRFQKLVESMPRRVTAVVKDEVEKLAYQLNEEAERTERPIRRLSKVMYGSTCADMQVDVMGESLSSIKHVVGEQLSGGSVVVVHEEPHPQMTGTLSYRPEETGGRQREKSLEQIQFE